VPILLVESGKNKGDALVLPAAGGAVTAGREKTCDLRLPDPMASRRHFEVRALAGPGGAVRYVIRDLKSSNGTLVNGARLPPGEDRPIEFEDKIQVGSTLVTLLPDEARASRGELTGRTVGGYRIEERLGRGAMGTVYKAVQLSLDRPVALKILARELARDRKRVEMFLSEARAAGKLNHPNIVQVYDVGEEGGLYFYSMEFMAGGSVEERLRARGRLTAAEAIRIAIDAAKGLEYAERQGIVHRDVKPANLMENAEGVVKIGDLGIARRVSAPAEGGPPGDPAGGSPAETDPAGIAGSPLYMAPEQARGGAVDHRADLYALGATLHHILAGEPPFQGSSPREVILKHMNEPPPALETVVPAVPADLAALVRHLLAKDPAERPPGASALLDELRAIAARHGEAATRPSAGQGRSRKIAAVAAAALVLIAIGWKGARVYRARREAQIAAAQAAEAARARRALEEQARAAEEARRQKAAEEEARARREADAAHALEAADAYLRDHADDLAGVLARYRDVAASWAGTAAEPRAKEQIEKVEPLFLAAEERRKEKEGREEQARIELRSIADAIETTPPEGLAALREKLEAARPSLEGTEAAARVSDVRRAIVARMDRSVKAAENEAQAALDRHDFAAARAAVERVAGWKVQELRAWVDSWRGRVETAAKLAAETAALAARAKLAAELERVEAADDGEKRAEFRHAEVRGALEALLPRLETPEARDLATTRIATLALEQKALAALAAHVNEGKKPPLTCALPGALEAVAVSADESGITFEGRRGGLVQVKNAYSRLSAPELQRFLGYVSGMPKDELAYATAWLLIDLGQRERGESELQRALREAGPAVRPLIEKSLAARKPR
jgi:hypothetical protein